MILISYGTVSTTDIKHPNNSTRRIKGCIKNVHKTDQEVEAGMLHRHRHNPNNLYRPKKKECRARDYVKIILFLALTSLYASFLLRSGEAKRIYIVDTMTINLRGISLS